MATPKNLSKDQATIKEHFMPTKDGLHTLYVQEWGNPKGTSVLFLHGGPGQGCDDGHKAYFDPAKHHVIFIDQRGCGKSTPAGSLKENDTQKLINDLELVRQKLHIASWHVTGGSWGSTLALCYAISHPDSINSMVLRGIFTGTEFEIKWFENGGYKYFFPDVWERYQQDQGKGKKISAEAYTKAVIDTVKLDDRPAGNLPYTFERDPVTIELHYTENNCFIEDNYIAGRAAMINMPVAIIQGRYDMICPPVTAYNLHKLLPNSTLHWTIAGHSGSDRANYDIAKTLLSQL